MVWPPLSITLIPQSLPWLFLSKTSLMVVASLESGVAGTKMVVVLPPFLYQDVFFMIFARALSSLWKLSGLFIGLSPLSSLSAILVHVLMAASRISLL
jgi:hypothetical protein